MVKQSETHFLSFSSLLSFRSSSQAKSARLRLLLARTGASPEDPRVSSVCFRPLAASAVFRSTGAPVGIRALGSDRWALRSLVRCSRGRCMPPKSSLGSVFSMPWSDGLKFCRMC